MLAAEPSLGLRLGRGGGGFGGGDGVGGTGEARRRLLNERPTASLYRTGASSERSSSTVCYGCRICETRTFAEFFVSNWTETLRTTPRQ